MGGLAVLVLLGLYVWGAYKLVRMARPAWARVLVTLAVVLVPTADAVYGRIKLRQMCAAEGGLKIYKTVEGVEGLYVDEFHPGPTWISMYGYRFVEGKDYDGKHMRLSLGSDGKIVEERYVTLRSRYGYEYSGGDFGTGYAYGEKRIRDLKTGEILARARNLSYEGGWAERTIAAFSDARSGFVGACQEGANTISPRKITNETLKPIK